MSDTGSSLYDCGPFWGTFVTLLIQHRSDQETCLCPIGAEPAPHCMSASLSPDRSVEGPTWEYRPPGVILEGARCNFCMAFLFQCVRLSIEARNITRETLMTCHERMSSQVRRRAAPGRCGFETSNAYRNAFATKHGIAGLFDYFAVGQFARQVLPSPRFRYCIVNLHS